MWSTESFRKKSFRHQNHWGGGVDGGGLESESRWLILFYLFCSIFIASHATKVNEKGYTRCHRQCS